MDEQLPRCAVCGNAMLPGWQGAGHCPGCEFSYCAAHWQEHLANNRRVLQRAYPELYQEQEPESIEK